MTARPINVDDWRATARRILPAPLFDFVDGGAEDELSIARNRAAWDHITLSPMVARTQNTPELSTTILGQQVAVPVLLAPCGEARLLHPDGAPGAARAAACAGTLAVVSTFCGSPVEDVMQFGGGAGHWFQLYYLGGHAGARTLIRRAEQAGYKALVITLDTPVIGKRERDLRHRISRPSRLDLSTFLHYGPQTARHPRWLFRMARAGCPLGEPNCRGLDADGSNMQLSRATAAWAAEPPTWSDIDWIRASWHGPIALKGIMSAADALQAVWLGVDAIIVSNHGGRQLDAAPSTAETLPRVADALGGDLEILVDGGIRRGSHVVRALAMGARAVLIGRPYLYGLAALGEAGVAQMLEDMRNEMVKTLTLIGCSSVSTLDRNCLGPVSSPNPPALAHKYLRE